MADLNDTSIAAREEASVAMFAAINGRGSSHENLDVPNLQHEIVAAALVLGKWSPEQPGPGSGAAPSDDYLKHGTLAYVRLFDAAARTIDDSDGGTAFREPGSAARHMVLDVMRQAGSAESDFQPAMQQEHLQATRLIVERNGILARERDIRNAISDSRDFDQSIFRPIDMDAVRRVDDLLTKGVSTGSHNVDAAIIGHSRAHSSKGLKEPMIFAGVETYEPRALMARSRLLSDHEAGIAPVESASAGALRIEADRVAMLGGAEKAGFVSGGGTQEDRIQSQGEYHRLPHSMQREIYGDIERADHVAPAVAATLGRAAQQASAEMMSQRMEVGMAMRASQSMAM